MHRVQHTYLLPMDMHMHCSQHTHMYMHMHMYTGRPHYTWEPHMHMNMLQSHPPSPQPWKVDHDRTLHRHQRQGGATPPSYLPDVSPLATSALRASSARLAAACSRSRSTAVVS